jgi:hypothetical protein
MARRGRPWPSRRTVSDPYRRDTENLSRPHSTYDRTRTWEWKLRDRVSQRWRRWPGVAEIAEMPEIAKSAAVAEVARSGSDRPPVSQQIARVQSGTRLRGEGPSAGGIASTGFRGNRRMSWMDGGREAGKRTAPGPPDSPGHEVRVPRAKVESGSGRCSGETGALGHTRAWARPAGEAMAPSATGGVPVTPATSPDRFRMGNSGCAQTRWTASATRVASGSCTGTQSPAWSASRAASRSGASVRARRSRYSNTRTPLKKGQASA